jgi:hypothetical protein
MTKLKRILLAVALILASSVPAVYSQSAKQSRPSDRAAKVKRVMQHQQPGVLIEEFAFWIKDFKVDHQKEVNTLNISISYRYVANIADADYPDFRSLAKDVETLLTNYPNEDDYWEIVNKQLTSSLMKKYPALLSLTSDIKADPTKLDPYLRSTRVTRERSNRKRM